MSLNPLLELLPRSEQERLKDACEPVILVLGQVITEPGDQIGHVFFPIDGFISLIAGAAGSAQLEVGMVGLEGMLGVQVALGVSVTPFRALVQGPGLAHRIGVNAFRRQLAQRSALRSLIYRYVAVLLAQTACSATCARFHLIAPRLARWLLMTHDCARANVFPVTQQFLSYMLGVRREGVTAAASTLQEAGMVRYSRGVLEVLDRAKLERASCSCYAEHNRIYRELMPATM